MSFFTLTISLILLFSAVASADIIYISSDSCSVNYFKQDSSGNFHESKDVLPRITSQTPSDDGYIYPYYDRVFAFRHNNKDRVLITKRISSDDLLHVMIYDPQDFSAPLASNDVTIPHCHSGGVEVFGNNIIIAKGNAVYEMNPETCEFVGEPYKASDSIGHEIDVLVHEGSIYLAEYVGGKRLEIMDKLGNITGRVDDFNPSMISSSGSIYFKASIYNGSSRVPGIFRMNHNEVKNRILTSNDLFTNSNYATKVVSGEILSFCPDGEGGCYYVPADETIAEDWGNEYIGHALASRKNNNVLGRLEYGNSTIAPSLPHSTYIRVLQFIMVVRCGVDVLYITNLCVFPI